MPTIKTKKEMNLPELIEWIERNGGCGMSFKSNRCGYVIVDEYGVLRFSGNFYKDTFIVEAEEPITEDMELHIVERYISGYEGKHRYTSYFKKSIKSVLKDNPAHIETTHIYAELNGELVLIWENGRLVE